MVFFLDDAMLSALLIASIVPAFKWQTIFLFTASAKLNMLPPEENETFQCKSLCIMSTRLWWEVCLSFDISYVTFETC